jgi:AcrR family transcriptional regulator
VLQADKTAAIGAAAFDELADAGWNALSMDRVAARAGVGKAALYRRWPSKDLMLLDLIEQAGAREVLAPDSGTLRDDLTTYIAQALTALTNPRTARIVVDVLAHTRRFPALADAIEHRFRTPRRQALRAVLQRGVARGELPGSSNLELGLDLIAGPLMLIAVGVAPAPGDRYDHDLADAVLRALAETG